MSTVSCNVSIEQYGIQGEFPAYSLYTSVNVRTHVYTHFDHDKKVVFVFIALILSEVEIQIIAYTSSTVRFDRTQTSPTVKQITK